MDFPEFKLIPRYFAVSEGIIMPSESLALKVKEEKKMKNISLLKSPKFINISIGTALAVVGDNLFNGHIRLVLHDIGFNDVEIATMSMVLFGSDLASRILYVIVCMFYRIRNRYVFFTGCAFTIIFRITYILRDDYSWRIVNLAFLGFVRCWIQTAHALVIADEFRENFATAYSFALVAVGIIGAILGAIMNLVNNLTESDTMMLHVLTGAVAVTVITWAVEFTYRILRKKVK